MYVPSQPDSGQSVMAVNRPSTTVMPAPMQAPVSAAPIMPAAPVVLRPATPQAPPPPAPPANPPPSGGGDPVPSTVKGFPPIAPKMALSSASQRTGR
jgi:hypothetical protein